MLTVDEARAVRKFLQAAYDHTDLGQVGEELSDLFRTMCPHPAFGRSSAGPLCVVCGAVESEV